MSQVEFSYNGITTLIHCNQNEKMKEILQRFCSKTEIDINSVYFLYSSIQINKELSFIECANNEDKQRNKMNILVNQINIDNNVHIEKLIKSKEVICPQCQNLAKIKINNYKISLHGCKNNHKVNNILLNEYDNLQNIDLTKIICGKCKEKNCAETFDNIFFWCCSCKTNLCPICKNSHDKKYHIINYEQKNYICDTHNDSYNSYCKKCKKNICVLCESLHENHEIIYFGKILSKINNLRENLDELRKNIDKFKEFIDNIIIKFNKVIENMEKYYQINNELINNYFHFIDNKNRNYELLANIEGINHDFIINDIQSIIKEDDANNQFNKILIIYNKMITKENYVNEIKICYKVNKELKIKLFGDIFVKNNKNICKMKIKGKEYQLQEYLLNKFNNDDIIEITLTGINNIVDMSCMFAGCSSVVSLSDISKMNTENITNMRKLFYDCNTFKSLPDISNWETGKVTSMYSMFHGCSSLLTLPDISKWEVSRVIDMRCMFYECSSLSSLPDISKWEINDNIDFDCMFHGCKKLSKIPSKFLD